MAPLMPTSQAECQVFSHGVEQYSAEISRQHDACLATYKADRPNEQMNSGICSRSACQNLHDQLYGDLGLSVRRERAEISTCFNRVNEYLREQAQAQQQEKQEEEDRKASEAADERAGQRQENDRKAEDAKDQAARDNSSGAAVPLAPPSVQPQPSTIRQSRTVPKDLATEVQARAVVEQEKKERANEATARMVDPLVRPLRSNRRAIGLPARLKL